MVETQKGAIEVEIFEPGVLEEWLLDIGDTVPVGTPMARVRYDTDTAVSADLQYSESDSTAQARPSGTAARGAGLPESQCAASRMIGRQQRASSTPFMASTTRQAITPAARRLAQEKGVDLTAVKATGPAGEIVRRDILNQTQVQPPSAGANARQPPSDSG